MVCFGDLPGEYALEKSSKIVVLPIPYDGTSTWVKGSDKGRKFFLKLRPTWNYMTLKPTAKFTCMAFILHRQFLKTKAPKIWCRLRKKRL